MFPNTVGIVDYGMGNLSSVRNAFEYLGADVVLCRSESDFTDIDRIVIPGVGAFGDSMANLRKLDLIETLNLHVLEKKLPTLGICLGMQIMARKSYEKGEHDGLGWFDAEVVPLETGDDLLRIPHIGWNNLLEKKESVILKNVPKESEVYFVHSYYMRCADPTDILAEFEYGKNFTAAVAKENIIATQFHPEKSQDYGLQMLDNFLEWNPAESFFEESKCLKNA